MELFDRKDICTGCFSCINICPNKSIKMCSDKEGFWYPKINEQTCVNCGLCKKKCPINQKQNLKFVPKAYACYFKDKDVRYQSSSGGIFSALAENIFKLNGFVFGAAINEKYNVEHISVTNSSQLHLLRGSKYVQSSINDSYTKIKSLLGEGKKVYFSGTPCQVAGLISFIGREHPDLICQDIICHGVPSPKVWKNHLEKIMKKKKNNKPISINFRDKRNGWNDFGLSIQFESEEYFNQKNNDSFMKSFLGNLSLRPSCYNCQFKTAERISDITLADCWGIEHLNKDINYTDGVSLVMVHTEKGKKFFEEINQSLECFEINIESALKYNSAAIKSVEEPKDRKLFFKLLNYFQLDTILKILKFKNFFMRAARKVLRIFKT